MATSVAMSPDVLINIKLQVGTENRRFKLPLRELGAHTLPDKVCWDVARSLAHRGHSDFINLNGG